MKLPSIPIPRLVLLSNMSRDLDAHRYTKNLKIGHFDQAPVTKMESNPNNSDLAGNPQSPVNSVCFEDEIIAKWDSNQENADRFKDWRKLCVMLWH